MIYKDASLGNPVHIAVVRLMMLRDQEFVLPSSGDDSTNSKETYEFVENRPGKSASEMLRNFCKWQRVFNDPDDSNPLHHDTALLLTRYMPSNPHFEAKFSMVSIGKTFVATHNCKSAIH